MNFSKTAFPENWIQIFKIVQSVKLIPKNASFLEGCIYRAFFDGNFHIFGTLSVCVQKFEISIARYLWEKIIPENVSNSLD